MPKPFILFCAGEDSGDILGEDFVATVTSRGLGARGTGGARMQAAGLIPIANFEILPVSGFWDVLPRYFQLRRSYKLLEQNLKSRECIGLIAIDYPGFNMKLCALAKKMGKKVLYVAPPQIWAWKKNRAQKLRDVGLAVLFDFEKEAYEKNGCKATLLNHPFLKNGDETFPQRQDKKILLLPGSRKKQALRNLKNYLELVKDLGCDVEIVAARNSLVRIFEQELLRNFNGREVDFIKVTCAPQSVQARRDYFASANLAVATPGTATLELALSGTPLVVSMVPDMLTYTLGKRLVQSRWFAMPNILLGKMEIPEFIYPAKESLSHLPDVKSKIQEMMGPSCQEKARMISNQLKEKLKGGQSAAELFGKFFQCDSH